MRNKCFVVSPATTLSFWKVDLIDVWFSAGFVCMRMLCSRIGVLISQKRGKYHFTQLYPIFHPQLWKCHQQSMIIIHLLYAFALRRANTRWHAQSLHCRLSHTRMVQLLCAFRLFRLQMHIKTDETQDTDTYHNENDNRNTRQSNDMHIRSRPFNTHTHQPNRLPQSVLTSRLSNNYCTRKDIFLRFIWFNSATCTLTIEAFIAVTAASASVDRCLKWQFEAAERWSKPMNGNTRDSAKRRAQCAICTHNIVSLHSIFSSNWNYYY